VDLYGGNEPAEIPEHVERELDAEAARYAEASDRHSGLWRPETRTERLTRWWRRRRHPVCAADAKAAAVARAESVATADKAEDLDGYFRALETVRREDGYEAVEQVLRDQRQRMAAKVQDLEFERQSTYVLGQADRDRLAARIFDDTDEA
jgi:hypothetical protein